MDMDNGQLTGQRYILLEDGAMRNVHAPEGPHIYKVNEMYYLMIAEGGTSHYHSVTIFRSNNITGPYEANKCNPILTHRHLGITHPINSTGHGDLVQTQTNEWWIVMLASRPIGGYYRNLGRETFIAPVIISRRMSSIISGIFFARHGKISGIFQKDQAICV